MAVEVGIPARTLIDFLRSCFFLLLFFRAIFQIWISERIPFRMPIPILVLQFQITTIPAKTLLYFWSKIKVDSVLES